jgi:hypothetical protein
MYNASPWKSDISNVALNLSSYLIENTVYVHYKDQSVVI